MSERFGLQNTKCTKYVKKNSGKQRIGQVLRPKKVLFSRRLLANSSLVCFQPDSQQAFLVAGNQPKEALDS